MRVLLLTLLLFSQIHVLFAGPVESARAVIGRLIGNRANNVKIDLLPSGTADATYEVQALNGQLTVRGSDAVAICHGFYQYLKAYCHSMATWGGKNLQLPDQWPDCTGMRITSPYHYRYYLNVVTYGYTMPYWDWARWEKELDWMALHGFNMPLALVASEAIAQRVWKKLGLKEEDLNEFFTGPAHLPWHRMGNLNKYDGPIPASWHKKQVALQHRILDRMRSLDMQPIAPAFAGFVPEAFKKLHPELHVNALDWGGFPATNHAFVLGPQSPWFKTIGKLFVQEWEKEFGKNTYYLSDSFNEMDVPVSKDHPEEKYTLLANYGEAIYKSVTAGNPNAVWVTQGWTFGYQHAFWDQRSLRSLFSKVPSNKLVVIDLGNEYPSQVWKIPAVWDTHEGFYDHQWIYSYVPNFGGKTAYTGILSFYASESIKALQSPWRKSLIGFGMAPEGIENNEVVYELLSDMGWTDKVIDLDNWIKSYCIDRYGAYPPAMKKAWDLLRQSCYNSFSPYPRFVWQTVQYDKRRKGSINSSPAFLRGVEQFLRCADQLGNNQLYRNDAIEMAAFYLGVYADSLFKQAAAYDSQNLASLKKSSVDKAIQLLLQADSLLESHTLNRLENWVTLARNQGTNEKEKDYYESNAKRLITTWGGGQSDYAARIWSGLIRDYYVPRLRQYYHNKNADLKTWEETWVKKPGISSIQPYADPLKKAKELVEGIKQQPLFGEAPVTPSKNQVDAVYALIKRVVPSIAEHFAIAFIPTENDKDVFELESSNGKIILRGNNGISIASALNYYLKHYAHCELSWNGSNMNLPNPLPDVPQKVREVSPYKYRYYLNYCTFNYSMSWWNWDRWQWEIDFMALNGINTPLALTGQNAIWRKVYKGMGFTDKDLESFFSGPAYFNWFWMGNLDGWGGPLPLRFMQQHEEMQKQILERERSLGMTPILPAFTGHVPPAFKDKFPNANLKKTHWSTFPEVYILDPNDPLFITIGKKFLEEETQLFGTDHLYSSDTFNENLPPTNDSTFLNDVSQKIYQSMALADPQAKWIMQGWLFHYQANFWKSKQIKAILNAVPNDNMIILDLWSENHPVWNRTDAYYGKPWIWCMLHNFGGNISMYGRMNEVAQGPAAALNSSNSGRLTGIGLTPEAIEQNPVMYALMLENVWRNKPIDVDSWLKEYVHRRYGAMNADAEAAWQILRNTVYEGGILNGGPESIISGRPTFNATAASTRTQKNYKPAGLLPAWDHFMQAASSLKNSEGFQYDITDLTRQVLANYADTLQRQFAKSYKDKNYKLFKKQSRQFLQVIDDMDALLSTRKDFLLGAWLEAAKSWGSTNEEKNLFQKNARDLITLWGDKNATLHDYSNRQWAGMLKGFYKPRWEQFFAFVGKAAEKQEAPDLKAFEEQIKNWEWQWVNGTEGYASEPEGDAVRMAKKLYKKYR